MTLSFAAYSKDYIAQIIPIDYSEPNNNNTEILIPSTYVNFSECEKILRSVNGILPPRKITFIQIELNNTVDDILVNQMEYQAYDDNKKLLNLSLYYNETIKISYSFKENTTEKIDKINYFKNIGVDILNIDDPFFNDVCSPYWENGEDLTLNDRIEEIYKNYTFCEKNCVLDEILYEDKMINCNCTIKNNLDVKSFNFDLVSYKISKKNMNYQVLKCSNALTNLKNNLFNLGFWIFSFLMLLNIILLILLCCLDIKPIQLFMQRQLAKYGYIDKGDEGHGFCHNYVNKLNKLIDRLNKMKDDYIYKKDKKSPPPKHKQHIINNSERSVKNILISKKGKKPKTKFNLEIDIQNLKNRIYICLFFYFNFTLSFFTILKELFPMRELYP